MKHAARAVLGAVVLLLFAAFAALWPGSARAETACGAEAAGLLGKLSRECWTADYRGSCFNREVTRARPGWYVADDGYWYACPPGVPDGRRVHQPKDCARLEVPTWGPSASHRCQPLQRAIPAANAGRRFTVTARNRTSGYALYECQKTDAGAAWTPIKTVCP